MDHDLQEESSLLCQDCLPAYFGMKVLKYSLIQGQSRGKLSMEIASVFRPKLMTFIRNVEFLGMILKTRVQEGVSICDQQPF